MHKTGCGNPDMEKSALKQKRAGQSGGGTALRELRLQEAAVKRDNLPGQVDGAAGKLPQRVSGFLR